MDNDGELKQNHHDNNNTNNNNGPISKEILNSIPCSEEETVSESHPDIKALIAACGERILNREFLLQGGGEPFVGSLETIPPPADLPLALDEEAEPEFKVLLKSKKIRGMKDLLVAKKLNTQAISLQMSAQSQGGKRHASRDPAEPVSKRSRRSNN